MLAPVTEIFCDIDDFCKQFLKAHACRLLPNPNRQRARLSRMSISEIVTIVVLFQMSHYRTFKDFYHQCILHDMQICFPNALSYTRFVACKKSVLIILTAYLISKAGEPTGLYYIDSTTLRVCHNKRIKQHRVFKHIAARSKSTMGWFYGFKLHLVINHQGEIVTLTLTKGNVDDRKVVPQLMKNQEGLAAGDKGYLSQALADQLEQKNLKLITKVRRNMKKKIYSAFERFFLKKRSIIETIIDQLKNLYHIEHSRHRSPINFLVNTVAALVAYAWRPHKPALNVKNTQHAFCPVIQN